MFVSGFEKVAYDSEAHMRDMEATDLKHMAKRNPYTWGTALIGGGAATAGLLNRWSRGADAKDMVDAAKKIRVNKQNKKLVQMLRKHPEQFEAAMKSSGFKRGALLGGLLGGVGALLHAKRVSQGRKLEAMPAEHRDIYLAGAMGH